MGELQRESAGIEETFHWKWTILAGGTLTVTLNVVTNASIETVSTKLWVTGGVYCMLLVLVLSPMTNLLAGKVKKMASVGLGLLQKREDNLTEVRRLVGQIGILANVKKTLASFSIIILLIGMFFLAHAFTDIIFGG